MLVKFGVNGGVVYINPMNVSHITSYQSGSATVHMIAGDKTSVYIEKDAGELARDLDLELSKLQRGRD